MLETIVLSALLLAQVQPMAPVALPMQQPLDTGPCLDSPRFVPRVLQAPVVRNMQVVRIDKVESTGSLMPGETIGFLYTLADGSTWLGQRTPAYMSGAGAEQINQVLSIAHMPGQNISKFPPQMREGVATKYQQYFQVQISPPTEATLRVQVVPCVAWPPGRPLPDPSM